MILDAEQLEQCFFVIVRITSRVMQSHDVIVVLCEGKKIVMFL